MHRILLSTFLISLLSCGGTMPPENILPKTYATFNHILAEDPDSKALSVAEFLKDDEYGRRTSLGPGVKVFLNETLLDLNTEVYDQYVKEQDTSFFAGLHKWVVQLPDGKKKEYPFEAKPFWLTTKIPGTVGKEDLVITCNGLSKTDHVFMMLMGDFSDNSEDDLEITPEDGKFTIPASFWKKVDPIACKVWFNISTKKEINKDEFFVGGEIEVTKVTRKHEIRVVR